MASEIDWKLLKKNGKEEGTLIIKIKMDKEIVEYFSEVCSLNRFRDLPNQLINAEQLYFYKKKLLVVNNFSTSCMEQVVKELEESGDLFDVMQPLAITQKWFVRSMICARIKFFLKLK